MTKPNTNGAKVNQEYAGTGFIVTWVAVIMLALVLVFLGRLLGYEEGPLPFHSPLLALLTATLSIVCLLMGGVTYLRGKASRNALAKRNGTMLCVLALCALMGFFVFKLVIPLIFG